MNMRKSDFANSDWIVYDYSLTRLTLLSNFRSYYSQSHSPENRAILACR